MIATRLAPLLMAGIAACTELPIGKQDELSAVKLGRDVIVDGQWLDGGARRSVWVGTPADGAELRWKEWPLDTGASPSELAIGLDHAVDVHHDDCAQLCDRAFDMLAALSEDVFPAAHGPRRDVVRMQRLIIPDRQLHCGVQRPTSFLVDLVVDLKTGHFVPLPDLLSSATGELKIAWAGDGKRIALATTSEPLLEESIDSLIIVDVPSNTIVRRVPLAHHSREVEWAEDGRHVAVLTSTDQPYSGPAQAAMLARGQMPWVSDVYVEVLDLEDGSIHASRLAQDLPGFTGRLMWDPKCVVAPHWSEPAKNH
jgi:hypothetical protein